MTTFSSNVYRPNIPKSVATITLFILLVTKATGSFAQSTGDTTDMRFHDDLLDHLIGNWAVTAIAHGSKFTSDLDAAWVMNHQNFRIHLKSHEIIPWWHVQMEYEEFVGYSNKSKKYIIHGMSIEGYDDDPSEGFAYGYRNGNEFKTASKFGADSLIVQRFTWQPAFGTWTIRSNLVIGGVEGEVFLDMNLVALKQN